MCTEFPTSLMVLESSFFGFAPKWIGPVFATLQHGTFQLYKVQDMVFSLDLRQDSYVGYNAHLSNAQANRLALRISRKPPAKRGEVIDDVGQAEEDSGEVDEEKYAKKAMFLVFASEKERAEWFEEIKTFLPRSRVSWGGGHSLSSLSSSRSSEAGLEGLEDSSLQQDQHNSSSVFLKDALRSGKILKKGIVLGSSFVGMNGKTVLEQHANAVDHAERRPWHRRYFELTCMGELQCFKVTMVACISLASLNAQIVLEEVHGPDFDGRATSTNNSKSTSLTQHRSSRTLSDDESSDSRPKARRSSAGTEEGGDLQEVVTVDGGQQNELVQTDDEEDTIYPSSEEESSEHEREQREKDLSSYLTAKWAEQTFYKNRINGGKSFSEQTYFPFTVAGGKVQDVPCFPYEKTSSFFSFFWRKVVFPNSVTVGTLSEEQRRNCTSCIREYMEESRESAARERKKRRETANIIAKCWMMTRHVRKFSVWKKRYAVLLSSQELVFYKNHMDGSRQGVLDLSRLHSDDLTFRTVESHKAIQVKIRKRAVMFYPCDYSESVLHEWLTQLKTLVRQASHSASALSEENSGVPLDIEMQQREGVSVDVEDAEPLPDPPPLKPSARSLQNDTAHLQVKPTTLESVPTSTQPRQPSECHQAVSNPSRGESVLAAKPPEIREERMDHLRRLSTSSPVNLNALHMISPQLGSAMPFVRTSNLGRLKTFSTAGSDAPPNSRSSSFDGVANANSLIPRLGDTNRSQSGGNLQELYAVGSMDQRAEEMAGLAKIFERTKWQRISGNVPIECLSLGPYSARILAEQLTGEQASSRSTLVSTSDDVE